MAKFVHKNPKNVKDYSIETKLSFAGDDVTYSVRSNVAQQLHILADILRTLCLCSCPLIKLYIN